MGNISRREFLGQAAALSAAFPFVTLGAKAEPAPKKRSRVEDYAFSSAVDVAQAIRRGDISSLELAELMFRRIDSINPKITPLSVWTELMENTTFFACPNIFATRLRCKMGEFPYRPPVLGAGEKDGIGRSDASTVKQRTNYVHALGLTSHK